MSPQDTAAAEAASFVATFNEVILFPTIALLSAVALLVFLYGCAEYVMGASQEDARKKGVNHITFGIIGLVIMVSAYAILAIAAATFGLDRQLECADNPTAGCDDAFTVPNPGSGVPSGGGGSPGSVPPADDGIDPPPDDDGIDAPPEDDGIDPPS